MVGSNVDTRARAVFDTDAGRLLASVELPVPPEEVFPTLTGPEVKVWWVNPGVFDTREWSAEVRVGGKWRAAGTGRGQPYALEGEFREIDPPRKLVHTWRPVGGANYDSLVTYLLAPIAHGTHLTIRHEGFPDPVSCIRSSAGWETSLAALVRLFA